MSPLPKSVVLPYDNDNRPQQAYAVQVDAPFRRFGDRPLEMPRYLIKGILPLVGVALLAGQFSSGKTFIGLDLSLSLIHGVEFLGRKTKPGGVLWLAAEGGGLIERNIIAARKAKFTNAPGGPFPFLWEDSVPRGDTNAILAELKAKIRAAKGECDEHHPNRPLRLVIIDTLAAYFALEDENDNAKVGTFMARLGEIAKEEHVLIVPICHMGKSAESGIRGASAFGAGADAAIAVLADINQATGEVSECRTISLAKTRDGHPGPLASFALERIEIGTDEDGDPVMPGYVKFAPVGADKKGRPPSRGVRDFIESVSEAMIKYGADVQVFEDAPPRRAVRIDHVRDEFNRRHSVGDSVDPAGTKRKNYQRAHDKVLKDQMYASRTVGVVEYIWPVQV
ncbi:AAA family ATPase [Bradyrhizobium sp. RT10b]|uniref:AAA family ATPase n=1 Tax=Bradyrhizobium sp. RT10b TaxID=3156331 RepID=UPI0033930FD4